MKYTLEHAKRPSDIHEHLPTLYNLVREIEAKLVLELGVRSGESTVALAEAVKSTGGKLISVDVGIQGNVGPMLESYGLRDVWEPHQSDDIDWGLNTWDRNVHFDLIFVDTSHEYQHTTREIQVFECIIRPGGIMAFHDTVSVPGGVLRPIQEFLAFHPNYRFENHANCNGLGVLRKPR